MARSGHTATRLPSGNVLVAGGQAQWEDLFAPLPDPGVPAQPAELYNPSTKNWTTTGPLVEERTSGHTTTLLNTGDVLVAGGIGVGGQTRTAELYRETRGTFLPAGLMEDARAYHTATLLGDGKVLVAGGTIPVAKVGGGHQVTNEVEIYDPTTGAWSDGHSLTVARMSHTATLLADGRILFAGGRDGYCTQGGCHNALNTAELYDPASGTSAVVTMTEARFAHTATRLGDGRVLLVGGGPSSSGGSGTAEVFAPSTNAFTATGPRVTADGAPLLAPAHTATLLTGTLSECGAHCGKVLVSGGAAATAELFTPGASGTWAATGAMHEARVSPAAAALADGTVLVAGGKTAGTGKFSPLDSAEVYFPVTRTFIVPSLSVADAPAVGESGGTAAFVVSLSGPVTEPVTVDYATADGTARAELGNSRDYVATSGTLAFAPGDTSKTVRVPVLQDLNDEPDETFRLVLSDPTEVPIARPEATATIVDDDATPSVPVIAVDDALPVTEGSRGISSYALFRVWISGALTAPATVAYDTHSSTLGHSVDYPRSKGTVTFVPGGAAEKFVSVPIVPDRVDESNEVVSFSIAKPANSDTVANARIGEGASSCPVGTRAGCAVGRIIDDDATVLVSVDDTVALESNAPVGAFAEFTVRLHNSAGAPAFSEAVIEVEYTTDNGTARGIWATDPVNPSPPPVNPDFVHMGSHAGIRPGKVVFAPGDLSKIIRVPLVGDRAPEPLETFTLRLSARALLPGTALDPTVFHYPDQLVTQVVAIADDVAVGTIQDNDPT